MPTSRSTAQSDQTFNEQDELLKYEYNLASCYEAEYLLSMKLEEDMIHAGKSECYYDGFEVQYCPTSTTDSSDQKLFCSGIEAGGPASILNHEPVCEFMETSDKLSSHFTNNHLHSNPTTLTTANGWLSGNHSPNLLVSQQPATDSLDAVAAMQNGHSQDNKHTDGPSKKRICLHH